MEGLFKMVALDCESRQPAFYHLFSTKERCSIKRKWKRSLNTVIVLRALTATSWSDCGSPEGRSSHLYLVKMLNVSADE